jgi:hypothetical protein
VLLHENFFSEFYELFFFSFCVWYKFEEKRRKMTQAVEQGVTVEVVRPEDGQRIEGGGPEEGEIVSAETQADGPTEAPKRHPLKHAWTFWFDNPNGKQKQSTWGSCIRAVYTFSTVEDFWWYVSATPFLLLCLFDFLDHISHFPYVSVC